MMVNFAGFLYFSLFIYLEIGLISLKHQFEVDVIELKFKRVVEHHEHYQGKRPLWTKIEDGDSWEEIIPIYLPTILEIENLKQPAQLLLGVSFQLWEQFLKSIESKYQIFGVSWLLDSNRIKEFFEFVDLDGLPKIFEFCNFDLFEEVACVNDALLYFWLGVVERH